MTDTIVEQARAFFDALVKSRFIEMIDKYETQYVALEDIVKKDRPITYGIVKPGPDVEGGVPVVKVKHYADGNLSSVDSHTSIELDSKYSRSKLLPGDILLSIGGTIGSVAIVPNCLRGANITQHTARLSIIDEIDNQYMADALRGDYFQKQVRGCIKGAAMKGLNLSDIKKMKVPLMPYDQQIAFSMFVKQVDKSKVIFEHEVARYDELIKSRFIEMFSDCPKTRLGNHIKQYRGVSYKPKDLGKLDDKHVPLLRANNIDNGELKLDDLQFVDNSIIMEEQIIHKGDIIICSSSGSKEQVGKSAYCDIDGNYTFGTFCKLIRSSGDLHPRFIAEYMKTKEYRAAIKNSVNGSNINNLRNEHIENLIIPYPSKEHQLTFVSFVEQVDKSKVMLLESLKKIVSDY